MALSAVRKKQTSGIRKAGGGVRPEEAVAFCPHCKAFQTVWINDDTLMPTRKFIQAGSRVYHDCGSDQPCRLYYSS